MLEKLNIIGYSDEKLSKKTGVFSVQINPEKYAQQYSTKLAENETLNTGGVTNKFVVQKPQDLSLEFYIDASGAVTGTKSGTRVTSVADEIERFKSVVYSYQGSIHSPNYLRLLWGKLTFDCRLLSMNIEYLLFTPQGVPLRAKLSTQFTQYLSAEKLQLKARKSSPDLTHRRTVVAGDTLPLLCFQIYQDSKYYFEIARFNRLNDFRNLEPGREILFPPLGG
jgi:Contractile injection system tube protein